MDNKQEKKLKDILAELVKTQVGLDFLKWLRKRSGFGRNVLIVNSQLDVKTDAMVYDIGRMSIYVEIRKLLPKDKLWEIEIGKGEVNE